MGILANGDVAFEFGKLISKWTNYLTVFTNGKATLTAEQIERLESHKIEIIETEIDQLVHKKGQIEKVFFKDASTRTVKALYTRPAFEQHCEIPKHLGCELTEQNYVKIYAFQKTTQFGIFACGDNTSVMRSVSYAVAMGGIAGTMSNKELIDDEF